ncbi:MAG TPA: hypothetical protein VHO94_01915 [Oscillospiraceae bacterium]|nr:hypothetical protein [Oscillospiraceae bacterium]
MTTILICGKRDNDSTSKILLNALENYGGVQYFDGNSLIKTESCDRPEFFLYSCEQIPQTNNNSGILLFKNSYFFEQQQKIPSGYIPVFESHNVQAAAALKGTGIVGVTCGTSAKDILSIASLEDTSATISLQRSVKTLTGLVLEPYDITIQLKQPISPFPLLMICSVLLLSGIPSNSQLCF